MELKLTSSTEVDLSDMQGHGGFGHVFRGVQTVAAKKISYRKSIGFKKYAETDKNLKSMAEHEIQTLIKLRDHKNIVKMFESTDDGTSIWITLEYCDLGNLNDYVLTESRDGKEKLNIMEGCASGLDYIHSFFNPPVIHGDIKPTNILLKTEGSEHVVKISDFGGSHVMGTRYYMPPEQFKDASQSTAGDVFSMGLVFYWLLQYSYEKNISNMEIISAGKKSKTKSVGAAMVEAVGANGTVPKVFIEHMYGNFNKHQGVVLKLLIESMTRFEGSQRITAAKVINILLQLRHNRGSCDFSPDSESLDLTPGSSEPCTTADFADKTEINWNDLLTNSDSGPNYDTTSFSASLTKTPPYINLTGQLKRTSRSVIFWKWWNKLSMFLEQTQGSGLVTLILEKAIETTGRQNDLAVMNLMQGYLGIAILKQDTKLLNSNMKRLSKSMPTFDISNINLVRSIFCCNLFFHYTSKHAFGNAHKIMLIALDWISSVDPSHWTSFVYFLHAQLHDIFAHLFLKKRIFYRLKTLELLLIAKNHSCYGEDMNLNYCSSYYHSQIIFIKLALPLLSTVSVFSRHILLSYLATCDITRNQCMEAEEIHKIIEFNLTNLCRIHSYVIQEILLMSSIFIAFRWTQVYLSKACYREAYDSLSKAKESYETWCEQFGEHQFSDNNFLCHIKQDIHKSLCELDERFDKVHRVQEIIKSPEGQETTETHVEIYTSVDSDLSFRDSSNSSSNTSDSLI